MSKIFQVRASFKIDSKKCTGCGACADVCPKHAIKITQGDGFSFLQHRYGVCLYCRQCARICPQKAISFSGTYEPGEFYTTLNSDERNKLEMEVCRMCGSAFATKPMLANVNKSLQESSIPVPENFNLCPKCRNKELVTNFWLVWKGKK
jgi:formate hydrogenlyase subunit 6